MERKRIKEINGAGFHSLQENSPRQHQPLQENSLGQHQPLQGKRLRQYRSSDDKSCNKETAENLHSIAKENLHNITEGKQISVVTKKKIEIDRNLHLLTKNNLKQHNTFHDNRSHYSNCTRKQHSVEEAVEGNPAVNKKSLSRRLSLPVIGHVHFMPADAACRYNLRKISSPELFYNANGQTNSREPRTERKLKENNLLSSIIPYRLSSVSHVPTIKRRSSFAVGNLGKLPPIFNTKLVEKTGYKHRCIKEVFVEETPAQAAPVILKVQASAEFNQIFSELNMDV